MGEQKIATEQLEAAVATAITRKVWKTPQVLLGTLDEAEANPGAGGDTSGSVS